MGICNRLTQKIRIPHFACILLLNFAIAHGKESTPVDFATEIEPIFRANCIDCHGTDEQESEFRVDRLATLLSGGNSGEPAVVPGKPKSSYLLKLVRHELPGLEMPPDGTLTKEDIAKLEIWIQEGAKTPEHYGPAKTETELKHWSFLPLRPTENTSIDQLIADTLKSNGLQHSTQANRRKLIRRLYLVMLGIPPEPHQVTEFVQNESATAWQDLVEQVLASPQYGERWGSYWLDLVRFGETHGFETNRERPNAWQYRDWVIQALNDDKPYNQFVREQIAGDSLDAGVATSFLVAGPYDLVKGQDPKLRLQQRMNELDDMINTTGTAFLGLTTGCARCHNHKFDPITQRDYYALQAVFAGVNHAERTLPLSPQTQSEIAELEEQKTTLLKKLKPYESISVTAGILLEEPVEGPQGTGSLATKPNRTKQDFGGKTYRWWKNIEGETLVTYKPRVAGDYRIWLSWGAGHTNHSTKTRYVIQSGNKTAELAIVNQQLSVGESGPVENKTQWSGFFDSGVHTLSPNDTIAIIGTGSEAYITADDIFLQPANPTESRQKEAKPPRQRKAVNAQLNEDYFHPTLAKSVRFTIRASSGAEGCIDELEIFSNGENIALAKAGAKVSSSGDFEHPLHNLKQINDGEYGNAKSWIVEQRNDGWVQVEFPKPRLIDHVSWGRDRTGKYTDRLPIDYRIEAANEKGEWHLLASSADRLLKNQTQPNALDRYHLADLPTEQKKLAEQWLASLADTSQRLEKLKKTQRVYAGSFSQPGPTHRLYRGEPDAKRERVTANAISAFTNLELSPESPEQQRRLALAEWIAADSNPLTARVIANRIWQFQFGTGIVDTPSDFGQNGSPPTHPQLLDFLAHELISNDWSLKHLHRIILNSKTWQQDNAPQTDAMRIDANSRLLWRFPPRRLEAEALRDSILAVSGVLELESAGGPGFNPFEVEMENVRHYHEKKQYGPTDWRRMIYMTKVRQEREHVFGVFDCPDASMVVARRSRSTTPLQALNLLNSRFIMQQADLFANRLTREVETDTDRVILAWHLCFQRDPNENELSESKSFIQKSGLNQFTRALFNTNEFVFIP